MHTETTTPTATAFNVIEALCKYVNQRPSLEPADYGGGLEGWRLYRRESAEITRDRSDFYELLNLALRLYDREELNALLFDRLTNTGERLTIEPTDNGHKLEYTTGQYWPTEYRPACSRVIVSAIWRYYQKNPNFETGHDIRKEARKNLSRRVSRLYFN